MTLNECLTKISYREYLIWRHWLNKQWSVPSRTDYYLMQIAREIKRVLSANPDNISTLDFKIAFSDEDEDQKPPPQDPKITAMHAKKLWMSRVGGNVTVRKR